MRCRQCGTEIADKALICYRCGAATTEPTFKPMTSSERRRSSFKRAIVGIVLLVLLVVLAVLLVLAA